MIPSGARVWIALGHTDMRKGMQGLALLVQQAPIPHDTALYRQRHKVENMFGKLKDWGRIHTRYDRCAHTFMSAICIAATVIFWLPQ